VSHPLLYPDISNLTIQVLQQHCSFFDPDHDNVIYPTDTYRGFHKLGFGVLLSLLAVFIIHPAFSYPSLNSCIPDPYFRVCLANIHKCKHGSDSGAYDTEGRFVPQRFEDMFAKYADGGDSLDIRQLWHLIRGQRVIFDPVGWFAVFFECRLGPW
jgi:peroxygenase